MNHHEEYYAISEYYAKLCSDVLTYVALMLIIGTIGFCFGAAT